MNFAIDDFNEDLLYSPIRKRKKDNIEFIESNEDFLYTDFIEEDNYDSDEEDLNSISLELQKDNKKAELKIQSLFLNNSTLRKDSFSMLLSQKSSDKGEVTTDENHLKLLIDAFDEICPLFYLTNTQRKILQEKAILHKFDQKILLYSGIPELIDTDDNSCFILLSGEIHIYNNKQTFIDLITEITLFGYDGPIFNKRISTVIVEKNTIIAFIKKDDFINLLHPGSPFATFISRNIRYKDKVLDHLSSFRNFVLSSINKGPIDIVKLLKLYKKFQPCLHTKCNSLEIDIPAWIYAINRLPHNIFESYVFILTNRAPRLLSLSKELTQKLLPKQKTVARNRDIYKYLNGKGMVVIRDLETDIIDFVCNLCMYIIESTKITKKISSPMNLKRIYETKENFKETIKVLGELGIDISQNEEEKMYNLIGNELSQKITHICINYQDVSISIKKSSITSKEPIELWIQNLWKITKRILGCSSWLTEIDDLVVDILQGSCKLLLSCISPHLYIHKNEILDWAKRENIQLKTQNFKNEYDELIAYSYYYYLAFPEKEKEKKEMNKLYGIETIEKSFGTGVKMIVINVNKLIKNNNNNIIPNLDIKPASKNHIIVHIGYTFGNQSHDLIKPVLMLFGRKLRSINIIGKCIGLIGNQRDIMVATRHFLDKTHDVVSVYKNIIDAKKLSSMAHTEVHIGSFLTISGTILQSDDLLNYYKYLMGCIGLEMEGYYYVREVENSLKHQLLDPNIIMRCIYYVLNAPNDPNLIFPIDTISEHWEEGIGAMNAIARYLLQEVLK